MAAFTLQPTAFEPSAHGGLRNTLIENSPQVSIRRAAPERLQPRRDVLSPMSDDFPTPKAHVPHLMATASDTESDQESSYGERSSAGDFDEMYDLSGSDSEEVPIKISASVKRRVGNRPRQPSIAIPSPSQWPTIEKLKSASALSPPLQMSISSTILARLRQQSDRVPSFSSTPSLDESLTSEELAASSCPSTPDVQSRAGDDDEWDLPVQLDPSAISLLHQINGDDHHQQGGDIVIEFPTTEVAEEMREVVSPPLAGRFRLETQDLAPPTASEAEEQLSVLSIPSPGGFFASLDSSAARLTWASSEAAPTTSTATEFYGVPFRNSHSTLAESAATSLYGLTWQQAEAEATVEQTVVLASPTSTQDPVTARKIVFTPTALPEVQEVDETYDEALKENAHANLDRTQLWLSSQKAYMRALCEDEGEDVVVGLEDLMAVAPKTPDQQTIDESSSPASVVSPGSNKKSVRFMAETATKRLETSDMGVKEQKRSSPIHDGTFWQGWRHAKRSQRARDVFQHRQARAEAEQVNRISMQKQHAEQLHGRYEIQDAERPVQTRPISSCLPTAVEEEAASILAQASRERQALQRIQSSAWHVAAQKEVHGGKLLTSPIVTSFRHRDQVRILDLAGQAQCGWAWTVALDHPHASIYTTVSSDAEAHVADSCHDGPANHFVVASPKMWELPFEDNFFDVVSARALYVHLRTTWPKGQAADEWDLTLRECLRVLKPGGYLEYDLLEAEMVHADAISQALGIEFAFNLKLRGYEPTSGKSFLPRLKRAGFGDIKRAWMVLPVADVVPRWTDAGKTPGSDGSAATVTPGGASGPDYFGADAAGERAIAADGTVSQYQPPLTGSTRDVRAVTGLVGARMWEQWMLKLTCEMGRSEARCLDDVAKALEEGGRGTAGWKCLVGWARKAE